MLDVMDISMICKDDYSVVCDRLQVGPTILVMSIGRELLSNTSNKIEKQY